MAIVASMRDFAINLIIKFSEIENNKILNNFSDQTYESSLL